MTMLQCTKEEANKLFWERLNRGAADGAVYAILLGADFGEKEFLALCEVTCSRKAAQECLDYCLFREVGRESVTGLDMLLKAGSKITSERGCLLIKVIDGYNRYHNGGPRELRKKLALLLSRLEAHDAETCECNKFEVVVTEAIKWICNDQITLPVLSLVAAAIQREISLPTYVPTPFFSAYTSSGRWFAEKLARSKLALSRRAVESAALEIARPRMAEICFALQELRLPALVTVLLIEEACWLAGTEFRRAHTWAIAATVKHWLDKNLVATACGSDQV